MAKRTTPENLNLKLGKIAGIGALVLILIAVVAIAWPSSKSREQQKPVRPDHVTVTIAGQPFQLELAITEAETYQGLSGRPSLPENGGMIFLFPDDQVRYFIMRDCLIDLDIIFLDATGRILSINPLPAPSPGGQPAYCISGEPARYVIELPGDTAARLQLKTGDRVQLDNDYLQQLVKQWG